MKKIIMGLILIPIIVFSAIKVYGINSDKVNTIEITTQFYIPRLDLRGYNLNHFEVENWFLKRINYHRKNYGLHPYLLYAPARITSIEHSLDMRDNNFGSNYSSDGRTHQQRHDRWFGVLRTRVTSSHISSHRVYEELTQEVVNYIVDRIVSRERTFSFLMNPTYDYIGIGFSIQENGLGRLNIIMVTAIDQRIEHRLRTNEEVEIHRQETLERIRQERNWQPLNQ